MNFFMELHERPEGSYICLLDIAKAFPSTPHVCFPKNFVTLVLFVHVDDIAVITNNANDMQRVPKRVQELSFIVRFQTNLGKK